MSTWAEHKLANETCTQCGIEYSVKYKELPLKDKDSFTCPCGNEIRKWKETGMYIYEKITKQ